MSEMSGITKVGGDETSLQTCEAQWPVVLMDSSLDSRRNRTEIAGCLTLWKVMVGLPGFEPGTSCTPSKRASQAAPQPESCGLLYSSARVLPRTAFFIYETGSVAPSLAQQARPAGRQGTRVVSSGSKFDSAAGMPEAPPRPIRPSVRA